MLNIFFSRTVFFQSVTSDWNNPDLKICDSAKKHILNFIKRRENSIFKLLNPFGTKTPYTFFSWS